MAKWFIYKNEVVEGPFNTEELKEQVQDQSFSIDSKIWGYPLQNWLIANEWHTFIKEQLSKATEVQEDPREWHYAYDGQSHGPLKFPELINALKAVDDVDGTLLWSPGMKNWESIFEFHEVVDGLGCTQRAHPRAAIEGAVVVTTDGQTSIGSLETISIGGLGAKKLPDYLKEGQEVKVEIKSEHFFEPVIARATVQYVKDGFIGMKFSQIHMETQARIIQYVKMKGQERFEQEAA